jgi:hypothetical protein
MKPLMRSLFLVGIFAFGCAHQAPTPTRISEADDDAPARPAHVAPVDEWHRNIKIVSRKPARTHYQYLGRVRGVASNADFVAAAKQARTQIARNAEKLGADVIKIEVLDPTAPGNKVLIQARAYRLAD